MTKKDEITKINTLISKCKKCDLWKSRRHPVAGSGSLDAEIFFIGEAPGRNEDIQGEPFVGKAGKILDELLASINIKRDEVYISNILKCRPPNNRDPFKHEIQQCKPFLDKQLEVIKPKLIIPLGNFATSYILEKNGFKHENIGQVHGKLFTTHTIYGETKIIPMYHPAVAVYNPNYKKLLLKDMASLKKTLSY